MSRPIAILFSWFSSPYPTIMPFFSPEGLMLGLATFVLAQATFARQPDPLPYQNPDLPVAERVEDLLSRMSLEEKVGQMNMPCVYEAGLGRSIADKTAGVRRMTLGDFPQGLGPAGGFFTLPNTILHEGPAQQAEFTNALQRMAAEQTRLGIPLLMTEEGTHGLMCSGGTIFPEGPALGSSWDLALIDSVYSVVAREGRAIGMHQLFTLVVEPILDPRLGRNQEAYSEDPFLTARYAETIVQAVQGDTVASPDKTVAGLCHYPGQSAPSGGLERGAMDISERMLRETFLPPWEAGIRGADALGVMATYPAIDGIPTHASGHLLTDVLRDELQFRGLVLSEGGGIETLVYEGLAEDQRKAGVLALKAGVDVGISFESGYMLDLIDAVRDGEVEEDLVDRAVRRILAQKFRLGLFENRFVDASRAATVVHAREHQDLALDAARKGIVLLKNDGDMLPLDRSSLRSIAVIGPNADNARNQLGDYTARVILQDVVTVLDGIRTAAGPEIDIRYVKGCDVLGSELDEIAAAADAARSSDVAVLVLGENEWQARDASGRSIGTSGEGYDVASLDLTGRQQELARAVVETGTPTIAVLINGRPLSTRYLAASTPAIVEAWLPGEKGGQAVAEVLFGDINPSGRLPVTIPRHVGQLPVAYDYKKSRRHWVEHGWGNAYADMPASPLFPFGHGLSYTSFTYADMRLSSDTLGVTDTLEVLVDVANIGPRAGREIVQLYVEDEIASVATPVKRLRGFEPVDLEPGERRTVRFRLTAEDLRLLDRSLRPVVEPGAFLVMVGRSVEDIRQQARFYIRN